MRKKSFYGNPKSFGNQRIMLGAGYYFYKDPFPVSRFPFPAIFGFPIRKIKVTAEMEERILSLGREGGFSRLNNRKAPEFNPSIIRTHPHPVQRSVHTLYLEDCFRHPNLDPAFPASRIGVFQAEISFSNSLIYLSAVFYSE